MEKCSVTTKRCSKCRKVKTAESFSPRHDRPSGLYSCCKPCKASSRKAQYKKRRKLNPKRTWCLRAVSEARWRSKRSGSVHSLKLEDVTGLTTDFCAYCDKVLDYSSENSRKSAASLDRIDPTKGYTSVNVVVCCYRCNEIKNNATPEELRKLAFRIETLLSQRREEI